MSSALTRRQQEVLDLLRGGYFPQPPTLDQLCRALRLKSRGSLHKHVMALVDAGYLAPLNGLQRGVRLTQPDQEASRALPLLGRIAAGQPIEAVAGDEFVTVPDALCGRGEHFVLRVRGDSMIEAGICDGDLAVIERAEDAHDGAIVAALIYEAETTLKRLQRRGELLYLCPANAAMQTLEYAAERVRVMGVLRGLMRRYR